MLKRRCWLSASLAGVCGKRLAPGRLGELSTCLIIQIMAHVVRYLTLLIWNHRVS